MISRPANRQWICKESTFCLDQILSQARKIPQTRQKPADLELFWISKLADSKLAYCVALSLLLPRTGVNCQRRCDCFTSSLTVSRSHCMAGKLHRALLAFGPLLAQELCCPICDANFLIAKLALIARLAAIGTVNSTLFAASAAGATDSDAFKHVM